MILDILGIGIHNILRSFFVKKCKCFIKGLEAVWATEGLKNK
jgi:hypothetical protein